MRKKVLISGIILFIISVVPLFRIVRELVIDSKLDSSYEINDTFFEEHHLVATSDIQKIKVKGHLIEIIEEPTGKKEV